MARKRGPRLSIIPAWAVTDARIDANALRVLCLFGRHTDDDGWCRRSQTKMADELGCSRSSVQRGIDVLVAIGCLQVEAGGRPGRSADPEKQPFAAHHYRVVLDPSDEDGVPAGGHPPVPAQDGHPVPAQDGHPYERPLSNDIPKAPGLFEQPSADPAGAASPMGRAGDPASETSQSPSPAPSSHRMARLAKMFEPAVFQAYFAGAYFREGPPLTLVMDRRVQCNRVRERFGDKIRNAFGDDHMVFAFEREHQDG